jgi:superfamily II DNA helicase RecQ
MNYIGMQSCQYMDHGQQIKTGCCYSVVIVSVAADCSDDDDNDESDNDSTDIASNISIALRVEDLNKNDFNRYDQWYILGHPEAFVEQSNMRALKCAKWCKLVTHVFVDEAHCIMQWGDDTFRPKYRELYQLRAIFPQALFTAVTATATLSTRKEICKALGMNNVSVVATSGDRPNIRYTCDRRPSHSGASNTAESSYSSSFLPFIQELCTKGHAFPKTVIYTALKWCGFGHQLAYQLLIGDQMQVQSTAEVTQYHAHLPNQVGFR